LLGLRLAWMLLLATPLASIQAQTAQPEAATVIESQEIRALAVGIEDNLRVLHILDASNQSVGTIRLRERSYSNPFTCPIIEGQIHLGVEAGVNEANEPIYSRVATVPWKSSFTKVAMVFIPKSFIADPKVTQAYVIKPMDMSEDGYESGTTKVVNFAPVTAYVSFGEHREAVERGQMKVLPKIEQVFPGNMAQLNVYHLIDEKPVIVTETRMRYLERIRYLIVLYPDFVHRKMGVASIVDKGNLF
jgi:hypothetical protein